MCTSAHPRALAGQPADHRSPDPDNKPAGSSLEKQQKRNGTTTPRKRHGRRWRYPSCPCAASSRPYIVYSGYALEIQTDGAAQKQEQREEGLAKTSSHRQAWQAELMQIRYPARVETWPSRDTAGSNAQTHHSAVVQPGDHSWQQTGQSSSQLANCTVLLLLLYLAQHGSLAVWVESACSQGSASHLPACLLLLLLACRPHIPTFFSSSHGFLLETLSHTRDPYSQDRLAPIN